MHKVLAMMRHDLLTRASYRFQLLISLASLIAVVVPVYFVADALQPMMQESIEGQGGHYFAFVLTGMIVMRFCIASVNSLPRVFGSAIRGGTLEAMFATPTSLTVIVAGMFGFSLLWTAAEAVILLLAGMILGAQLVFAHLLVGLLILSLIVLAYLSFGVLGVALHLVFRTTGPLLIGIVMATNLLGGVYYPTEVIPSWIQKVSALLPMTYGLRALRQTVLEGAPVRAVYADVGMLLLFLLVLLPISWAMLHLALRYSRRAGTLAHY